MLYTSSSTSEQNMMTIENFFYQQEKKSRFLIPNFPPVFISFLEFDRCASLIIFWDIMASYHLTLAKKFLVFTIIAWLIPISFKFQVRLESATLS